MIYVQELGKDEANSSDIINTYCSTHVRPVQKNTVQEILECGDHLVVILPHMSGLNVSPVHSVGSNSTVVGSLGAGETILGPTEGMSVLEKGKVIFTI